MMASSNSPGVTPRTSAVALSVPAPLKIVLRNGLLHTLHLCMVVCLAPLAVALARPCIRAYAKAKNMIRRHVLLRWELGVLQRVTPSTDGAPASYCASIDVLRLAPGHRERILREQEVTDQVVLADIDQDGFYLPRFGDLSTLPTVSPESFVPRNRYRLQLVAIQDRLGVRKDYRGDYWHFVNELTVIRVLRTVECRVPLILNVDFSGPSLTTSYIHGEVLREQLARQSAIVRDRDVVAHPDFKNLSEHDQWLKRIEGGRRVLQDVVGPEFADGVFKQLQLCHRAAVVLNDIKYGNIVIEDQSGLPFLIDFDAARHYPRLPRFLFRILRDRDIATFNLHFGTARPTYDIVKHTAKRIASDVYAPAYLGAGLHIGNIWNVSTGYGRWHYILAGSMPDLRGKRVLDLGANNGVNALQLLRNGVREVVAVELSRLAIEQGRFMKEAYEWADNAIYRLRYVHGNMGDVPEMDLGRFDLVLALCSLYYMDDEAIEKLANHVAAISPVFVVQCNTATNIGRKDPDTYRRASVDYAAQLLERAGFTQIRRILPFKYTRPLLIGTKRG